MNRTEALFRVQKDYTSLSEMERDTFAFLANRLLQTNYFIQKKSNVEEYRFFVDKSELFESYFSLIDIEFGLDQVYHTVFIRNIGKYNRLVLSKFESQVLLALRYLHNQEFSKVTLNQDVAINYSDLNNELKRTGAVKENLKKSEITPVLRKYKNYNLIDYIAYDITTNNDARITIYPSILFALQYENIQEVLDRIESYDKGGKEDEETDED